MKITPGGVFVSRLLLVLRRVMLARLEAVLQPVTVARLDGVLQPVVVAGLGVVLQQVMAALLVLVLGLACGPRSAWAGAQAEEVLADSVRTALSAAIRSAPPPEMEFPDTASRLQYLRWLTEMSHRLRKREPQWNLRRDLLQTVWYESKRASLDPALVLGLIQVESNFRRYAVSSAGARGYMQVMPFWARQIGDGDPSALFHTQTNMRFGCVILRHYLDVERGNLFMSLGRYNGSRGKPAYPDAVLAARRNWEYVSESATPARTP